MHELALIEGAIEAVSARLGQRRVTRVRLRAGPLAAVLPDAMRFCFDVCTRGTTLELELPIACSYDLDLASARYLHAQGEGEVPLRFLFRGTLFGEGPGGLEVTFLPWDREAAFALPIATWRAAMDALFPGQGWLRLRRDLLDALLAREARRALPTWDAVVADLLRSARDDDEPARPSREEDPR